jgi:hypothetical protein
MVQVENVIISNNLHLVDARLPRIVFSDKVPVSVSDNPYDLFQSMTLFIMFLVICAQSAIRKITRPAATALWCDDHHPMEHFAHPPRSTLSTHCFSWGPVCSVFQRALRTAFNQC